MRRENAFKSAVTNGDVVFGAEAQTNSPALVEVYGSLGVDFVWVDFEHGGGSPTDSDALGELTRAAEVSGTDLLVRLPSGDPSLVRKALDAGVRNLLIPRVESASEVERAVRASRFKYDGGVGKRGVSSARSSVYGDRSDDYIDAEDDSVVVGVMIETAEAVDALDEILAVPELGFVFVGHGDLSVSLGHPLETDHPEVRSTMDAIEARCRDADVPLGGAARSTDAIEAKIDAGYRVLRVVKGEISAVREVTRTRLDELERARRP
jgi:2-dehydro-3-deoxyglucarate aldolase